MIVVSQSIVNSGLESEESDSSPPVDMCEINSHGFLDTDSSQLSVISIWEEENGDNAEDFTCFQWIWCCFWKISLDPSNPSRDENNNIL